MQNDIYYLLQWSSPNVPEVQFKEVRTLKSAKDTANVLAQAGNTNISLYEVVRDYRLVPTSDWFDKSAGPRK